MKIFLFLSKSNSQNYIKHLYGETSPKGEYSLSTHPHADGKSGEVHNTFR